MKRPLVPTRESGEAQSALRSKSQNSQARLDSWKAIAHYLGRSTRTVQRWHSLYSLPIRHLGGESGSVFAYANDLDHWMRNRGEYPASELGADKIGAVLVDREEHSLPSSFPSFDRVGTRNSREEDSASLTRRAQKLFASLSGQGLPVITRLLREAIDLDPDNGSAFVGLSQALMVGGIVGHLRGPSAYAAAKVALDRAMELDRRLPDVACALNWLILLLEHDLEKARRGFEVCLRTHSTCVMCTVGLSLVQMSQGKLTDASELLDKAVREHPLNSLVVSVYAWSEFLLGRFGSAFTLVEEAHATGNAGPVMDVVQALAVTQMLSAAECMPVLQTLVRNFPRNSVLRGLLGYSYAREGDERTAHNLLEEIVAPEGSGYAPDPYAVGLVYVGLCQWEDAANWLKRSRAESSFWSFGFAADPFLQFLHDEPFDNAFLDRYGYNLRVHRPALDLATTATPTVGGGENGMEAGLSRSGTLREDVPQLV